MNIGIVLGLIIDFILGTSDGMYVGIEKITDLVYLISGYNVLFLELEDGYKFTLHWESN